MNIERIKAQATADYYANRLNPYVAGSEEFNLYERAREQVMLKDRSERTHSSQKDWGLDPAKPKSNTYLKAKNGG